MSAPLRIQPPEADKTPDLFTGERTSRRVLVTDGLSWSCGVFVQSGATPGQWRTDAPLSRAVAGWLPLPALPAR